MSKKQAFITCVIFLLCAAGIAVFAFWPFNEKPPQEKRPARVIIPVVADDADPYLSLDEYAAFEDSYSLKAPLNDGEFAITVLNVDFSGDAIEEQFVVYHSINDAEIPVSIAFFGYDERDRGFRRLWDSPVGATMPGTVSLYSEDLLGDRSFCIIITGMNMQGEHTMTVFRRDLHLDRLFTKIAEITTGGSITVQEAERPPAYQQGIARGQPFIITAWEPDSESNNMLDRIEVSYTYNALQGTYEQNRVTRIPGSQIEQRRLREILTGEPKVFEDFIFDLWYHVSPEGIIDKNQYLYFDPVKREIIFFEDEALQVFAWQRSASTRYGIYISSQNISVTTMRRYLDIEMESLDSIRIRAREDVMLKIGVNASLDGSYRRAESALFAPTAERNISPYTNAVYDSSMGRLRFYTGGEYELSTGGVLTKGRYAFFRFGSYDMLELRPERNGKKNGDGESRLIYKLSSMDTAERDTAARHTNLSLSRVRLGASGIHDLYEPPIILTRAQ